MPTDFIPSTDADFGNFYTNLANYVSTGGATLGLTSAQESAFAAAFTAWSTAWDDLMTAQRAYNVALATKDTTRAAGTMQIREVNRIAQAYPAVTDASLEAAGLPVHKKTRTPVGSIETHPVLYRVDNEHLLQRLWFSDSATPGSKAKPKGASLCEIRQTLVPAGGAAPTDPETMPLLALDTKSPHRTDFESADVGKTAYYAQRWVNTRGEPGPWSIVTSYLVT